jgi:hypothetical protein
VSDIDDIMQPVQPPAPSGSDRVRWTILPSNGEARLDRKLAVDARSWDWKKLAQLLAFIDFGLKNSCAGRARTVGFKAQLFVELDSADAKTAEAVIRKALHQVGFTDLTIQKLHAQNHPSRYGGGSNNGARRIIFPDDDEG